MKNARKVIAMVLVLALTVAMSVAGTIAYLKDTDEAVNVLTMGNVQIFQNEQQRTIDDEVETTNSSRISEKQATVWKTLNRTKNSCQWLTTEQLTIHLEKMVSSTKK